MPTTASAHQPLFVGLEHSTPELGPRILDGTVSFAVYGSLDAATATRGFRFTLQAGDRLFVELLIPDQEPERALADDLLPHVDLVEPDGTVMQLTSKQGERFDEPFSGTSYIRLASLDGEAVAGTYGLLISGNAPARFTAVVGNRETVGEIEGSPASGSVAEWWASPPANSELPALLPATSSAESPSFAEVTVAEPTNTGSQPTVLGTSGSDDSLAPPGEVSADDGPAIIEQTSPAGSRDSTAKVGWGVNGLLVVVVVAGMAMIAALTAQLVRSRGRGDQSPPTPPTP
jgi:hypothetical protein